MVMSRGARTVAAVAACVLVTISAVVATGRGVLDWLSVGLGWALVMAVVYWLEYPAGQQEARRMNGQCVRCGYDLTANVSGVCPECGSSR